MISTRLIAQVRFPDQYEQMGMGGTRYCDAVSQLQRIIDLGSGQVLDDAVETLNELERLWTERARMLLVQNPEFITILGLVADLPDYGRKHVVNMVNEYVSGFATDGR